MMGLAMVKKYIETLGGSIKLSSEINQGFKFIFTIPKTQPEYAEVV